MKFAKNLAGGLLCLRSDDVFNIQNPLLGDGFFVCGRTVEEGNKRVTIINVYASCDSVIKKEFGVS